MATKVDLIKARRRAAARRLAATNENEQQLIRSNDIIKETQNVPEIVLQKNIHPYAKSSDKPNLPEDIIDNLSKIFEKEVVEEPKKREVQQTRTVARTTRQETQARQETQKKSIPLSLDEILNMNTAELAAIDISTSEFPGDTHEKFSLRQRVMTWRKKNAAPKRIADADSDEIPFAWKNSLISDSNVDYTERLLNKLSREAYQGTKMPQRTE